MYRLIVFSILLRSSMAVIYTLNETMYSKMPMLYDMDDYSTCLAEPDRIYCAADFELLDGQNKELLDMIHGYSEYKVKHYNHTLIHRAVCVSTTCKNFLIKTANNTVDLNKTLEVCLNSSIWRDYKLQVKLKNINYCTKTGEKHSVDGYDIFVGLVILALMAMNAIGTGYDAWIAKKGQKSGNPFLLSFSVYRNWKKLIASSSRGIDPRMDRLKLFYGMRTITMFCVFFSHTVLVMAYSYVDNPRFIETAYEDPSKQILFNGTLVTHTFFVMSAFLLAYNLEIYAEKHHINWLQWPKGMLLRYLRLTPVYALQLGIVCTWMRFLGSGPLWKMVVETEWSACRQYWWAHLLYINNYIFADSQCAPQTWYLAADTQLFCFALLLCVLCRTKRSRIIALVAAFVVSLIIVACHTYFDDLDAVVLQSPESYRNLYAEDKTFRLVFIRGHTNLSTYIIGLAGGFLAYHWQTQKNELAWYKRNRWAYWLVFPSGVGVILSGGWFYRDGVEVSTAVRVLYATLYRSVFQAIVLCFIMGTIFKVDTVYRGIVEWRGFTWMGRVSYSAFLVHSMFQRGLVGAQSRNSNMSDYYVMMILTSTIFLAFWLGAVLWLCVETPLSGITQALLSPRRRQNDEEDQRGE